VKVAERLIEHLTNTEATPTPLGAIISMKADEILSQGQSATERYAQGTPIGPLDGVPVGVKDELDQTGFPTTVGTGFLGTHPAVEDATVVARLRAAGALLIGKLNMHEIGIGVTGINPHHGAARNPYNRRHMTGGSSSGSGSAVGMGLCPIAVGADGGGSIRIPASLCGVVGLKATYGRISEHGAAPLCWSVAHVGPLGATVYDVALAYAIMAGPDPFDLHTRYGPEVDLNDLSSADVHGLRIGIFEPHFQDADDAVVEWCTRAVDALCARGARRVPIEIPQLGLLRTAHMVTIVSEMLHSMNPHLAKDRTRFGYDVRMNLALGQRLTQADYIKAQRMRPALFEHFNKAFETVDVIVTPSTGCTAPLIRKDALKTGESDLVTLDKIMRFSPAANLTGLPSISIPVGYDDAGLPIGLQVMGPAWSESRLLKVGLCLERCTNRQAPDGYLTHV